MKLVDNYLSNLSAHLPDDIREDVQDELEASIYGQLEDITEQQGFAATEQQQAQVLERLGHPMRVAAGYQPNQQLVGPEMFPMFKKTFMATLIVVLSINLLNSLPSLATSNYFIRDLFQLLLQMAHSAASILGVNAIICHLIQNDKASLDKIYAWSPYELKHIKSGLPVSRFNTFFEIAVTLIFMAWWNNWLQWSNEIDVNAFSGHISLSGEWDTMLWPVNALLMTIVAINMHKFWYTGWTTPNLFANAMLNVVMAAMVWHIIGFENYVVLEMTNDENAVFEKLANTVHLTVKTILWVILFANLWEIYASGKRLYKR